MAIFSDSIPATLALNVTSGVMFATVTTLPYGLLADYHDSYKVCNLKINLCESPNYIYHIDKLICISTISFFENLWLMLKQKILSQK